MDNRSQTFNTYEWGSSSVILSVLILGNQISWRHLADKQELQVDLMKRTLIFSQDAMILMLSRLQSERAIVTNIAGTTLYFNNVSREAQIMILVDHPNVLTSQCSFVNDHNLWLVMPFMAGGYCLHMLNVTPKNGFTYDHIIGTKVSSTIFDENGTRHTAAYLLQYANPKGLSVLVHATVHKILLKTIGKSRPLAYGVVFEDFLENNHQAYLKCGKKDEIILSAGALASPQLLMLSDIGPRKLLDALKIKVVLEQPFIGQDLHGAVSLSIVVFAGWSLECGCLREAILEKKLHLHATEKEDSKDTSVIKPVHWGSVIP